MTKRDYRYGCDVSVSPRTHHYEPLECHYDDMIDAILASDPFQSPGDSTIVFDPELIRLDAQGGR